MKFKYTIQIIFILLAVPALTQSDQALSLDDCIRIGLEQNQSLMVNRLETDRSISQAKSNISMVLPSINYSLSSSSADVAGAGWSDSYSTSLSLSQNIWDGGRWWNTLKSAKAAQIAADMQLSLYELNTAYQVKVAYYNYLSTLKLLDVYRENLNTSEYQHQLTRERFNLGAASQNDTLRTKVNIERAKLQIIQAESDLQSKARDLNIILGREADSPLALVEPVWETVQIPTFESVVNDVLSVNPQLQLLDQNREITGYNVKVARSGYIPSLNFGASYSNGAVDLGDVYDGNTATLSTGLSLSWNIFNGTQTKRSVEQSKITRKIAEENYDLAQRNVRKDLTHALEQMETLQESLEISELILDAAELDLELAQEQYRVGSLSILDVITITANYEDAKSGFIRAQYNLKIAEAGLHQLMGKR
ncbi:MAG: TolC family protein [Candidatus Marinimicrobia bacterium]|nr:TolC family protein [Candidatus Neomarinimicrobiota bacterium]MCF7850620.1 TolC family protein [Candidatus Neomarinimicrobiota bacterium]MCF7903646.1 TolC family protein [Candidatus Neomarinimicrobiota bacterium]